MNSLSPLRDLSPPAPEASEGGDDIAARAAQLEEDFALLDAWEERYGYVIELGKTLPAGGANLCRAENKVQGCVSQVWLESRILPRTSLAEPARLRFAGYSDAHIVRGLIAILLRLYNGRAAEEILAFDALELFARLGFQEHLVPQRANGLAAMLARMRADAADAVTA